MSMAWPCRLLTGAIPLKRFQFMINDALLKFFTVQQLSKEKKTFHDNFFKVWMDAKKCSESKKIGFSGKKRIKEICKYKHA